ncbi:MAG: four helix bundle protein [Candidatus Berkelbacteria bacterium]
MGITNFEDIVCWKKARILVLDCYSIFKQLRDYSFKDQLFRCAISVMNNIAEGYERQTNKEFRNFLYIANGSAGELRSMLYLAKDLKYINEPEFESLYNQSLELVKMISGLIRKIAC